VNHRIVNILKYLLGWPFSILAFVFIIRIITPQTSSIAENLESPNIALIIASVISFLLFYFFRSAVWHVLLRVYKGDIRFRTSSYFWASSELKRYIPGNIWGFVARTFRFADIGITKKDLGRLIVIEAGVFVMAASLVSLLSLPYLSDTIFPWITPSIRYLGWSVMLIGTVLYLYNFKINRLWGKFTPRENFLSLFFAALAVLFFGFGYYFAISAIVTLPPDLFFALSGFFVLSFLIGALSLITPAGFGVREGIIIVGLSKTVSEAAAGFLALFARFMLVATELIFVFLMYVIYKVRDKRLLKIEDWISYHKEETGLIFLYLVFTVYFTTVSFLRHDNFYTGRFDLGNMVQTVWNTTQGRFFELTDPNGVEILSRLAFHADFLLVLLAPFYALFPTPKALLFIQAVIAGAGCFLVYKIALSKLKNKSLSLALSFSYLLNPGLQRSIMYDFHAVVLATTFLLATFYFYSQKRYGWFLVFAALSAISKEQIWLVTAVFGLFIFIKHKKRLLGALVFAVSAFVFYYLMSVAIPKSLGDSHFALSYFSQFGSTPIEVIKNIAFSPQTIIGILFEKEHLVYLRQIFLPVGFLPLLAPVYLIFAAPDLMINLLSSNPQLHQIYYQYTAVITPFLYISTIYGLDFVRKLKIKSIDVYLSLFVLMSALIGAYLYGPLPGSKMSNLDMFTRKNEDRAQISSYISGVPEELSVASSNNIGAHLSERERIYVLPNGLETADVVAFLILKSDKSEKANIERELLGKIRQNSSYELDYEKNGFVVFVKK
jgi:uncharacterized membrane protein/uncharacterized membrane protein YbhN (UPF0104 family)